MRRIKFALYFGDHDTGYTFEAPTRSIAMAMVEQQFRNCILDDYHLVKVTG